MSYAREHRHYKDALLETWESEPEMCHPGDLDVLGGLLVSGCSKNAMRCSLLSTLWTPSIKRLMQRYRLSERGQGVAFWDHFWDTGPSGVAELWENRPEWQQGIRHIILTCLSYLAYTGYDT